MLSQSFQRKPGSADVTFDFWLQNCERISSMLPQGPELWSFVWQPQGTKTQFLFWKLPGLTTSLWSLATMSSSAERSRLRPAGGALPTLAGSFWNEGASRGEGQNAARRAPAMCIFSYRPPRCCQPVCLLCSGPPGAGQAGTCVTVTTGTEGETEARGRKVIFLMSYS